MLFNSLQFAVFFLVVSSLYFLIPRASTRRVLMFLAGCWFYMALIPKYIIILFCLILTDFIAGIYIDKSEGSKRKAFLVVSILLNIGTLCFFKYTNFVVANINDIVAFFHGHAPFKPLSIILPIGLSFHTFQSLSYVIEVYRGHEKAEKNLLTYALYVLFYPQLVAGPIERPAHLLKQLQHGPIISADKIIGGLSLMSWGFFKKIFVADRLAQHVNDHFAGNGSPLQLLFATYFFAFQIYCDFSGYTDIARGIAKTLGYELCDNFNHPYSATSIGDFWRRWHISLSTWFRDYVYIPLGGNRTKTSRVYFNIMVVFLLSGLWHGANWTYVIWGGLHGAYLIGENLADRFKIELPRTISPLWKTRIKKVLVFHLVSFAWIFFRAATVTEAFQVIHQIFSFQFTIVDVVRALLNDFMVRSCTLIVLLLIFFEHRIPNYNWRASLPKFSAYRSYYYAIGSAFLFFLIITGGAFSKNVFVYFQF